MEARQGFEPEQEDLPLIVKKLEHGIEETPKARKRAPESGGVRRLPARRRGAYPPEGRRASPGSLRDQRWDAALDVDELARSA